MLDNLNLPTIECYNGRRNSNLCNTRNKEAIFYILVDPENARYVLMVVGEAKVSPLSVYDRMLQAALMEGRVDQLTNHEKQFVGAVVRVIMEGNGFAKAYCRQRFPKGMLKSGEIYRPVC